MKLKPTLKAGHDSKTVLWLLLSNITKSLSQWGILVVLIKFFSTEEVGYFTLAMALAAPVFMLSDMQLKSVLIVEPFGENDNFRTYQSIRFFTTFIATLGLVLYCIFFRESNKIILAIIMYKSVESLLDIVYGYLQKCDKMIQMAKLDILKTLIAVLSCSLVAFISSKIILSLSSLFLVSILFYIVNNLYVNSLAQLKWRVNKRDVVDIIKKSFPLGISVFFSSYIINYPRISIEGLCGPDFLAYFGSYSYLAIGMFQIYVPLQIFLRQRLSICYQHANLVEFKSRVRITILALFLFGMFVMAGFFFVGDYIVRLLYDNDYVKYSDVMYSLIVAQTLTSISGILAIAVLSFNVYTRQAFISLGVLVVVLVLTPILVNCYGVYGGGYINVIAAFISLFCYGGVYLSRLKKWEAETC